VLHPEPSLQLCVSDALVLPVPFEYALPLPSSSSLLPTEVVPTLVSFLLPDVFSLLLLVYEVILAVFSLLRSFSPDSMLPQIHCKSLLLHQDMFSHPETHCTLL